MLSFDSVPEKYLPRQGADKNLHFLWLPNQIYYLAFVLQQTYLFRYFLVSSFSYLKYQHLSTIIAGCEKVVLIGIEKHGGHAVLVGRTKGVQVSDSSFVKVLINFDISFFESHK